MDKVCSRCHKLKSVEEFGFNKRRQDGHQTYCRDCNRIYQKGIYRKNTGYYQKRNKRSREENRKWWNEVKSQYSCTYCGESHPACIDFHHTDPSAKETEISTAKSRGWPRARILVEMKKCEPVCSNCHRKLHWEENLGV